MANQPNLDYDPGPPNASFSRLGPPTPAGPAPEPASQPQLPAPSPHYETAGELVPSFAAPAAVRRPNRRRHKYTRRRAHT